MQTIASNVFLKRVEVSSVRGLMEKKWSSEKTCCIMGSSNHQKWGWTWLLRSTYTFSFQISFSRGVQSFQRSLNAWGRLRLVTGIGIESRKISPSSCLYCLHGLWQNSLRNTFFELRVGTLDSLKEVFWNETLTTYHHDNYYCCYYTKESYL